MVARPLLVLVFVVLALGTPTEAQETPPWESVADLAQSLADQAKLPALAIAWGRLDQPPTVGVYGSRWLDGEPLQADDRFHLGSLTKAVTATAIARLVEQGVIDWSDRIGDVLPDLEMNPAYEEIQLQELLRHRGRVAPDLSMTPQEIVRLNAIPGSATQQRLAYVGEVLARPPLDRGFTYSNAGYAVAAAMAERASTRSWQEIVQGEVFDPLRLESCGFGWPSTATRPDQPRGHHGTAGDWVVQPLEEFELGAFISPAGNTHCSVEDLARFGLAHLQGLTGRDGLLRGETIAELHRIPEGAPYAAGWGVDPVSGQHRHDGSVGSFYSYLVVDPGSGMVVAVLTNVGPVDGRPIARQAVAAVLERYGGP